MSWCSQVSLREYPKAPSTARSLSPASASSASAWSGWVATNTRFTRDALDYGKCAGLYLLSWNHPRGGSLKERIDHTGLYPITVSTLLTQREKQFLLNRDVVLCKELLRDQFLLDHLDVGEARKQKILSEMECLYHREV